MPQAVTHILIPIILLSLYRDSFVKNKKAFPLHYILIGGVAGVIPDLDIAFYYILGFFGFTLNVVHRTFSHNLFFPLIFVFLGIIFFKFKNNSFGKHHLKLHNVLFVIAFGIIVHLILDALVSGIITPFYPFLGYRVGLNAIGFLPDHWKNSFIPSLDGVLLVFWVIYLELKHRISDFI